MYIKGDSTSARFSLKAARNCLQYSISKVLDRPTRWQGSRQQFGNRIEASHSSMIFFSSLSANLFVFAISALSFFAFDFQFAPCPETPAGVPELGLFLR